MNPYAVPKYSEILVCVSMLVSFISIAYFSWKQIVKMRIQWTNFEYSVSACVSNSMLVKSALYALTRYAKNKKRHLPNVVKSK